MKTDCKRLASLATIILSFLVYPLCIAHAQTKWEIFASLNQGRHLHAARYLNGDKILVIGGYVNSTIILGGTPTNTTEIIDLSTGVVTAGPPMAYSRSEFSSLMLPDGDILVIGGYSNNAGNTAIERFDVDTYTWSVVGTMKSSRRQHCADFLNGDEILIFGGLNNSTAEIFTISTGKSELVARLPGAANSAVSINPDGRGPSFWGYRSGGEGSDRPFESIRYEKATNKWAKDLVFDDKPVAPQLVNLADGSAFVVSGAVSEAPFRTSTRTWTVSPFGEVARGPSLVAGRQWHVVGTWNDDRILVGGGIVDGVRITGTCEWLELPSSKSVRAPTMNIPRAYGKMILARAADGRMRAFVVSGLTDGKNTPTIEVLQDSVCAAGSTAISLLDMRFLGSAKQVGQAVQLTSTEQYQSGAAWLRNKLPVRAGFDIRFKFRLSNGNDNGQIDNGSPGADGVALVFQNSTPVAIGKPGDGIGYNEMPHGIAVEFDSYLNAAISDSSASHIAVQKGDGMMLRPWHVSPYYLGGNFHQSPNFVADGSVYHARVVLDGKVLTVYCDTIGQLNEPVLTIPDLNFESILSLDAYGACYVGFTSSTGRSSEVHEIFDVIVKGCQPLVSSVEHHSINNEQISPLVYPLPATDIAMLRLDDPLSSPVECNVINVRGQVVAISSIEADRLEVPLNVSSLDPGIYTVVFRRGVQVVALPLVIVR